MATNSASRLIGKYLLFCVLFLVVACAPKDKTDTLDRPGIDEAEGVIFIANEIITMDRARPMATAVAVRDGKIVDVGYSKELMEKRELSMFAVDNQFQDNILTPGFIEQHVHPLLAALTMQSDAVIAIEDWNTPRGFSPKADGEAEFKARLSKVVASIDLTRGRPALVWGYHAMFHGPLSRQILDEIAPDVPLIVWQRSAHEGYVNTAAMEMLGIDQAYVDRWSSELARSQVSLEKGHFFEAAFFEHLFFEKMAPFFASPENIMAGLEWCESYFHRNGITVLAEPAGPVDRKLQSAVAAAFGADDTPFNFYFIPDGRTLANRYLVDGPEKLISETEALLEWSQGRTKFLNKQVKLFADGAIYSQLMMMRDGYLDGHHGEWLMEPDVFESAFQTYWSADYQIHIHYNGDGGLDTILDVLERAQARHPRRDHRTVLVHFGYAQPDQIKRASKLGAIVSANPVYTTVLADKYAKQGIGAPRTERMVPLAEVLDANMPLSLHSDMPMAPASPLYLMGAAVNRITSSGWVPGENLRINPEQALRAVTLDAAFSIGLEDQIGSIETGKKANFTILEENPLTVDPLYIDRIQVVGTVLEGRVQRVP